MCNKYYEENKKPNYGRKHEKLLTYYHGLLGNQSDIHLDLKKTNIKQIVTDNWSWLVLNLID